MYSINRDKTNVEIDVTISNEEWEKGMEKAYQKNKSKYMIAGFRKGHAPRKAIEKEYGDGVFFDDTLEDFVNQILAEAFSKDPELDPVEQPQISFESYSLSEGTKFKILMKIIPDFKLTKYTGLSIRTHDYMSQLERYMKNETDRLLHDHVKFETADKAAEMGDVVVIDYIGFKDNEEFEGGSGENYPLELGSGGFIDNFEEQLVGSKKGDKRDVNVRFPDDYRAKDLAGCEANFKVDVKEVRKPVLPELDDKFISDTTEFETLEEYQKDLQMRTETKLKNSQDQDYRRNIIKYLSKNTEIEIPDSMVESQINRQMNYIQQIAGIYQMTVEQYISHFENGMTLQEYVESMKSYCKNQIKHDHILRKIIKEQNITCTDEEIEDKLKEIAEREGREVEHDEQHIQNAEGNVLFMKVNQFLQDNNKQELIDYDDNSDNYEE